MTKEIKLTQGKVAIVDDELFEWLNQWKWCYQRNSNAKYTGYATRHKSNPSKTEYMHRVIMNPPKGMDIDHIDGDGLNNQRNNLRICTHAQNGMNRSKNKNNSSGFKGVFWDEITRKWRAIIDRNDKHIHLGRFSDIEDAAKAYDKAARELYGEFAYQNFTDESK